MPAGLLVTLPLPAPAFAIVSELGADELNVAAQLRAPDMVTLPSLQSASPLQPSKVDPAAGVAVKFTTRFSAYKAVQVTPQLIPTGTLVTVPTPVPALLMVNVLVTPGVPSNTLTFPLPSFATARSALPSPLKSPAAIEYGELPTS